MAKVRETVASITSARIGTTSPDIRIICYGLAFISDIDDLKESLASVIVKSTVAMHAGTVVAAEPNIEVLPLGLDGITRLDRKRSRSSAIYT